MGKDDGRRAGATSEVGRYSRLAGTWIRWAWREAPPRLTASSRSLVGAIERELRARRRRIVAQRWTLGALAAGAAATTMFAGASRMDRLAGVSRQARDAGALAIVVARGEGGDLERGAEVRSGTRLLAPEGEVLKIASADGTELTLEPGGSLTVVEAGATKRFALMRGAVLAHVKKLGTDERFIVDTADAEVEVHGTIFRVALAAESPACGVQSTTRVSVSEGVVSVSGPAGRSLLFPGDEWPAACVPVANATVGDDGARPSAVHKRAGGRRIGLPAVEPQPAATTESSLATPTALEAQNDLFLAAMRAKRRGNASDALRLFEHFIRSYPGSSLIESAIVQRMRLLAAGDVRAGAEAAARYLERFPDGFAHGEARKLAGVATVP